LRGGDLAAGDELVRADLAGGLLEIEEILEV
jgi:hypothetical protein